MRYEDLASLARQMRAPKHFLDSELAELDEKLLPAIERCAGELSEAGFAQAEQIGEEIASAYQSRRAALGA